jgi:hypothetical protein
MKKKEKEMKEEKEADRQVRDSFTTSFWFLDAVANQWGLDRNGYKASRIREKQRPRRSAMPN